MSAATALYCQTMLTMPEKGWQLSGFKSEMGTARLGILQPVVAVKCGGSVQAGPDHEWTAEVYQRAVKGTDCPFCANRQVSVTNSLQTIHPELAKLLHVDKNGEEVSQRCSWHHG
jgi:hypothetical protein